MSFSALAEQPWILRSVGSRVNVLFATTDMNVKLIDKGEMDGSDRYKQLVSNAVDKGLRVFGYYGSSVAFELKKTQRSTRFTYCECHPG